MKNSKEHRLSVIYGGQWGSEGKGQIAAHIAVVDAESYILSVRVGGPNAGHTITDAAGIVRKVQQIPVSAFVRQDSIAYIGAAGFILLDVLERELGWLTETWKTKNLRVPTLVVDPQAIVIERRHMDVEAGLVKNISSTGEGVGAAQAEKVMRVQGITVQEHYDMNAALFDLFEQYGVVIGNVQEELHCQLRGLVQRRHLIVEGTQGYNLSLNASGGYPFVTSRDCGPEAIMGQIGISFREFHPDNIDVVCCMRTFPIRVGGPSGPLPGEITWDELKQATGGYVTTPETTTVTGKQRRIGRLSWPVTYKMLKDTQPTSIALTFLDYQYPGDANVERFEDLSQDAKDWLCKMEQYLDTTIRYVSTGPDKTFIWLKDDEK